MRILYLITQDDLGGAGRYVLTLARAFQSRAEVAIGHGPDGNGWLSREARASGLRVLRIPHLRRAIHPLHDLRCFLALRRLIAGGAWDVVHANSSKAGVMASLAAWTTRPAFMLYSMKATKVAVVYTAHGWLFLEPLSPLLRAFYFLLEWIASRGRSITIVLSEREARVAEKRLGIPASKIAIIPHGLEQRELLPRDEARRRLGIPNDNLPTVGVVANFYKTKGLDLLLDAVECHPLAACQFRLMIIGDGPERPALEARIRRLDLSKRSNLQLHLLGSQPNAAALLAAFDLFALPSRKEGLPFALLEAIAAGLPIIATDVGGVREALGDAGLIIPPNDADALARALHEILTNEKLRRTLVERTRARADVLASQHTRMIEQTWKIYTTCASL